MRASQTIGILVITIATGCVSTQYSLGPDKIRTVAHVVNSGETRTVETHEGSVDIESKDKMAFVVDDGREIFNGKLVRVSVDDSFLRLVPKARRAGI